MISLKNVSLVFQGGSVAISNISTEIKEGEFVYLVGHSGSGKSSLIIDTLYQRLDEYFNKSLNKDESRFNFKGINHIDKVIDIDQSPIGRTPRSNPATYTGCFTPIRDWFANLNESSARGYKPGRFSFNVKGGRCESVSYTHLTLPTTPYV